MAMRARFVSALILLVTLSTAAYADGSGRLDTTSPEIVLSVGTTGHLIDLTPDLVGIPQNSAEISRIALVPLPPGDFDLAFTKSGVKDGALMRTVVLSRDGVWTLSPLQSESGGAYFVREATLSAMTAQPHLSWFIVQTTFSTLKPAVSFTRGEVLALDPDGTHIVVSNDPINQSKFKDILKSNPSLAQTSPITIDIDNDQKNKLIKIDLATFEQLKAADAKDPNDLMTLFGSPYRSRFSDRFTNWDKIIDLDGPSLRIDCNETITVTQKNASSRGGDAHAKLDFTVPETLAPFLTRLGVSLEAGGGAKFSLEWSDEEKRDFVTEKTSLVADKFYSRTSVSGREIPLIRNEKCDDPQEAKYFTVRVPAIPGNVVSKMDSDAIVNLDNKTLSLKKSGFIASSCVSIYVKAVQYLENDLGLDEIYAQFIAAHVIRVASDANRFFSC